MARRDDRYGQRKQNTDVKEQQGNGNIFAGPFFSEKKRKADEIGNKRNNKRLFHGKSRNSACVKDAFFNQIGQTADCAHCNTSRERYFNSIISCHVSLFNAYPDCFLPMIPT